MMDWHDGGMGWGGGVLGGVLLLILLVLAVVGVVALVRAGHGGSLTLDHRTPEQLLDERLARGEIDIEEYTRRRELLRSARQLAGNGTAAARALTRRVEITVWTAR